jgi:hypothetical protein
MTEPILRRIELADGGAITLYDWMSEGVRDGRNLVRTNPSGEELWRAEPPFFGLQPDHFTQLVPDPHRMRAYTFSCYEVAIDFETGKVTVLTFTK